MPNKIIINYSTVITQRFKTKDYYLNETNHLN